MTNFTRRITSDIDPPALPGIQHTKTVLALTAIEAAVEQMLPLITDKKTADQVAKVCKWVDQCSAATKVKRLSSGAKRELESACSVLAPYIEDTAAMDTADSRKRWAELFFVGVILSNDVQAVCPLYGKSREWRYLDTTTDTLGRMLLERYPGCDEAGTTIYMSMHGYEWGVDGQEMKEAA